MESIEHLLNMNDPEDLLEMMGLDQDGIHVQDFGRERGANPQRSDAQVKALNKLAASITNKEPKGKHEDGHDGDGVAEFDILGKPRVILFQGKVTKKSLNSVVTHHTSKRLILFNDCIIIANAHGSYLSTSETLTINVVIKLEEFVFVPFIKSDDEKECAGGFELRTPERPYFIIAESDSDKRIWCEEINLAVRAYMQTQKSVALTPGWQHNALRGNLFSAVYTSDLEDVTNQISLLESLGKGIDDVDDSGMTALHWAALGGYCVSVEALLDAGANIDPLNNGLNSPLLLAAIAGNADIFIFLVERGADVLLRNLKDRDALFLIVMYANNNRGVQVMVDILIARGLSVDLCDSSGSSPLHECASLHLAHSVDMLVAAGADVNLPHARSGLTPLQISVSRPDPDPETVRTLLQHGAFANSLTSSKVNAMDLVMQAFSDKHNLEFRTCSAAAAGGSDKGNFKISAAHKPDMDMDTIAEFAMGTLPVLMEIAKHGGRYTEHTLAPLRDSFIEAVQTARSQWLELTEPADFHQFVQLCMVAKGNEKWSDNNSPHCLLCVDKFTMYKRRHHCRECGILCCDACSSKKISQKEGGKLVPQRVCDSCFNILYSTYRSRAQDLAILEKNKMAALREADELRRKAGTVDTNAGKKSLFSWGSSSSSTSSADTRGSSANSPRGAASETMDALNERGERLKETADKAAELNEAAGEFNRQTKLLLQQQRQQGSIWRS